MFALLALPEAIVVASVILSGALVYSATVVARRLPSGQRQPVLPLSPHGYPVEPTGIKLGPEPPIEVGARVLAFSQGQWWRARVIAIESDDVVRVHFPGWDATWDENLSLDQLEVDLSTDDERIDGETG
jgi:hypothetical protein